MGIKINRLPCAFMENAAWRKASQTLSILTIILIFPAGSVWSLDRLDPADVIALGANKMAITENNSSSSTSSSAMADTCLPLLQSIRQTTTISAMDRNQRTAGKAAALGLVLGIRFALSPAPNANTAKSRIGIWQPNIGAGGDRRAIAIAEYRSCQKEQALRSSLHALESFRWER